MDYMLLIMEAPGQRQERSEAEGRALYQRMLDFAADLRARGKLKLGQSLTSQRDGTRVQVRNGKRALVDGPFAEAREMVGGFFLPECDTREDPVATPSECPAAQCATVDYRRPGP